MSFHTTRFNRHYIIVCPSTLEKSSSVTFLLARPCCISSRLNRHTQTDRYPKQRGITRRSATVETTLFVAVDNMNKGSDLIAKAEDWEGLIRLNYDAAHAALENSAVEGAVQYIRSAVALLSPDCLHFQYEVALDIYSLAV